jgi:hypothetical protein
MALQAFTEVQLLVKSTAVAAAAAAAAVAVLV